MEDISYVYLISDGTWTKIGVSKNPARRLKSLQTGSSQTLRLIRQYEIRPARYAWQLEKQLHKMFQHRRFVYNREYFLLETEHFEIIDDWLTSVLRGLPADDRSKISG